MEYENFCSFVRALIDTDIRIESERERETGREEERHTGNSQIFICNLYAFCRSPLLLLLFPCPTLFLITDKTGGGGTSCIENHEKNH
jgi:hypothetical protein